MNDPFANLTPETLRQIDYFGNRLLAEGFVREGYLELSTISDEDLIVKINELVKSKFIKGDESLSLTFDHTDKLLERAKEFESASDLELTSLFYMLFIEHRLNHIARTLFRRKNIPERDAIQIVRKLAIRDKATWLFTFLGCESLPDDLLQQLNIIEEYRNAYVHFKWVALYEKEDKVWLAINEIKRIIDWLEMIDDKYIFHGQKSRLILACMKIVKENA